MKKKTLAKLGLVFIVVVTVFAFFVVAMTTMFPHVWGWIPLPELPLP